VIDPVKVTDYSRSMYSLEEFLLFCVLVANKNATRIAISLEKLLEYGRDHWCCLSAFEIVKAIHKNDDLPGLLKHYGVGCYNRKAEYILKTANCGLDLRACTTEDLEAIPGIGMKTARYFILHTRKNAKVACLDTHMLKWLSYYTKYDVPDSTPTRKKYLELEQVVIKIAEMFKVSNAELDLLIWNKQRGTDDEYLSE
jgi:thermostable 8-oxoguanine DNA glycosylase